MVALAPQPESPTVAAMRAWWESHVGRNSRRLGASQIGEDCERRLWYGFRWATAGDKPFDGRMLRLFDRGNREEAVFIAELRGAGLEVWDRDPTTGDQYEFTAVGGHFVAKIDGICRGVKEAPVAFHLLSFKTANDKGFTEIRKNGPGAKYEAQSQSEMQLASVDRTLFLVANKNDDQVHGVRLRRNTEAGARLLAKAERVVYAAEPPPGISQDPAFYKCKMCPAAGVCHTERLPAVNCRTCLHATPEPDGDGRWSCALAPAGEAIPAEFQARGCDRHLFVPALLARWGDVEDASEEEGAVYYRARDGHVFANAVTPGPGRFTSRELRAATPALIRSTEIMAIRDANGGRIVERDAA